MKGNTSNNFALISQKTILTPRNETNYPGLEIYGTDSNNILSRQGAIRINMQSGKLEQVNKENTTAYSIYTTNNPPSANDVKAYAINNTEFQLYHYTGILLNGNNTGLAGYGSASIIFYPNNLAKIDFSIQITGTSSGETNIFTWGINRDFLTTTVNNKLIIPITGGSCAYYNSSGALITGLQGYGGTLQKYNQFWQLGRVYTTDGNIGSWPSSEFTANMYIVGTCYGTIN